MKTLINGMKYSRCHALALRCHLMITMVTLNLALLSAEFNHRHHLLLHHKGSTQYIHKIYSQEIQSIKAQE